MGGFHSNVPKRSKWVEGFDVEKLVRVMLFDVVLDGL